ncbi:hypothetical protein M0R04_02780 [Candidatus Dojkabacteria bacterium]|nr:hypothetical protein [Candidatus Dojkabacteria bacterium]
MQNQIDELLKQVSEYVESGDLEDEMKEDLVELVDRVKLSPTKENLLVLSKILSSVSKASLAEVALNIANIQ